MSSAMATASSALEAYTWAAIVGRRKNLDEGYVLKQKGKNSTYAPFRRSVYVMVDLTFP